MSWYAQYQEVIAVASVSQELDNLYRLVYLRFLVLGILPVG
jgi:hypothetical protein